MRWPIGLSRREAVQFKMPLGGHCRDPPNQESSLAWMWTANLTQPDVFKYTVTLQLQDGRVREELIRLGQKQGLRRKRRTA
jgi:hypothetical protein